MLAVYGFEFFVLSTLVSITTGSFWVAIGLGYILHVLMFSWLGGFVIVLPVSNLINVWYPLFSILGALLGCVFQRYLLNGHTVFNWKSCPSALLTSAGFLLLAVLSVWPYSYYTPWFTGILVWLAVFLVLFVLYGMILKYLIEQDIHCKMAIHEKKDPKYLTNVGGYKRGVPCFFASVHDLGLWCVLILGLVIVFVLAHLFYLVPWTTASDADFYVTLIAFGLGSVYLLVIYLWNEYNHDMNYSSCGIIGDPVITRQAAPAMGPDLQNEYKKHQ